MENRRRLVDHATARPALLGDGYGCTCGDVHDQLGGLAKVWGRFWVLGHEDASLSRRARITSKNAISRLRMAISALVTFIPPRSSRKRPSSSCAKKSRR